MRRGSIPYSEAEMQWLDANRMMILGDYHRAFVQRFERDDVTAAHLNGLRKRKGWKVGRAKGRYVGRHTRFSDVEIAWLRDNCTMMISDYHKAFCAAFGRDDVSAGNLHGLRKREGWKTGRTGQFEKGREPANKGKTMPYNANSARTRFKAGAIPHTWRGAGHEAVGADGYVWLIVDEQNPYTGAATRRVQKHRWLWQHKHGPVPDGHALKCIDGDKTNTAPENWECIPTGLLPRLNGKSGRRYDQAPAELKPTILAVAKLEHAARRKREVAE
jgi:hypothetical protein